MVLSYNMSGGKKGYKGIIVFVCLMKNQRNTNKPESHRKSMVTTRLDPDLPDSTEATSNYHSEGNK